MTMNNELLKVTTTPVDADVQIPAASASVDRR
jgi:hypothetical protein